MEGHLETAGACNAGVRRGTSALVIRTVERSIET